MVRLRVLIPAEERDLPTCWRFLDRVRGGLLYFPPVGPPPRFWIQHSRLNRSGPFVLPSGTGGRRKLKLLRHFSSACSSRQGAVRLQSCESSATGCVTISNSRNHFCVSQLSPTATLRYLWMVKSRQFWITALGENTYVICQCFMFMFRFAENCLFAPPCIAVELMGNSDQRPVKRRAPRHPGHRPRGNFRGIAAPSSAAN